MNKRHLLQVLASLAALLTGAYVGWAQNGSRGAPAEPAKTHASMTVEDVVRLSRAGVSEEIILAQISRKNQSFDLTANQLIELKSASVSERIIRAMLDITVSQPAPAPVYSLDAPPSAKPTATTPVSVKHPDAQPAPPAPANVTATVGVPLKTVSAPVKALQWVTHTDPMGFSVNSPADWNVSADPKQGRIDIQGPQGQRAVIWPMFVRGQQLDGSGSGIVLQQLARRVDPKMAWGTSQLAGDTVRVFARGQNSGAALMRWSSSPDGTAIYLFCVTAPGALYQTSVDTFAGILKSFHVVPDEKANGPLPAKNVAAAEQVAWARWTDPREGAFSASVPQGWSVSGGAFRQSATDIRQSLVLLSPDHQIRMAVGDANVGAYTVPTPMYASAGIREGGYATLGDGSKLQIRRFLDAQQYVREYVANSVRRECDEPRILSANERQDLAASATQRARGQGALNPQVTAAGVSFSCTWNGREARGYYAAATIVPFPGRNGIWYVEALYGYLAVAERQQQADDISRHVLNSMGINAQWKQRENQIAGNAVEQDNARSQEIQTRARRAIADNQKQTSEMIVKGHQARSQVYDEISRKRENAILGTVDVVDPNSGKQYKIDNYSDYHWMNHQGVVAGTKTDTSPGADWRQLITLP